MVKIESNRVSERLLFRSMLFVLAATLSLPQMAGGQEQGREQRPAGYYKLQAAQDGGLSVTDLTKLKANDLVAALLGTGVVVTNVKFTGTPVAAGIFTGGLGVVGFERGIILSTGAARSIIGPNQDPGTTTENHMPGDSQIEQLIPGLKSFDAAILEFDFVPQNNLISFQYVFSSEEYNEFVGSQFNDTFGFFLNGRNVALLPGTNTSVAINNVNGGKPFGQNPVNPQFYINNDLEDGGAFINTEMDGLTVVLAVQAAVNPGQVNHLKLAIADASDAALDSNVFIKAGSLSDQLPQVNDLAIAQTATPEMAPLGGLITYTIKVRNQGTINADPFAVTETLPGTMSFISCIAPGGNCTGSGNNRVILYNGLNVSETATITLVAKASCTGKSPSVARVLLSAFDPNPGDNQATTTVAIVGPPVNISLASGRTALDFGMVQASREPDPQSPSDILTIENTACSPFTAHLSLGL